MDYILLFKLGVYFRVIPYIEEWYKCNEILLVVFIQRGWKKHNIYINGVSINKILITKQQKYVTGGSKYSVWYVSLRAFYQCAIIIDQKIIINIFYHFELE